MARLFGTDGIRGSPTSTSSRRLAYALGPGGRPPPRRAGRGDRRRPGHASIGRHVRGRHRRRRDEPGGRRPRGRRRPDAGPGVPRRRRAIHGRDHGLRLAQPGRRQRAQGPRQPRPQARRRGRGRARAADLADRGARRVRQRRDRPRRSTRGPALDDYRRHRLGLAATFRGRGSGSSSMARTARAASSAPEILAATGATVEVIHAEPDGDQHQRRLPARPRPPRWPRRSSPRAPTSASPSTATPTG